MVPRESAVMNMPNEDVIALDADHIGMTKFVNSTDPAYQWIVQHILKTCGSKGDKIGQMGELNISLDVCPLIFYRCSRS